MFCVFTWMAVESFEEFSKLLLFEERIFACKCRNRDNFHSSSWSRLAPSSSLAMLTVSSNYKNCF